MPLPHTDSPSAIRAFGLNYQTTIDYPGLQPAQISEYGDITIKSGEVPTRLDGTPVYGRFFQASSNQLLLTTNTIANFLIEDGQRIQCR